MAEVPTLRDVGEHPFLAVLCDRLRARGGELDRIRKQQGLGRILVGPGDDCAVVEPGTRPLALTTDAVVEGVHFRAGWLSPPEVGERAVAVNLSDLAAMGATPSLLLVAVAAPAETPARTLDDVLSGCARAGEAAGAAMVGGNLTRGDALAVTVTAIGAVTGPCLTRAGAEPGDLLVVTGSLGGAAAAVASWVRGETPAPELRERFAVPVARLAAGRALAVAGAHAAIDVSDGLLADLEHLCTASGVGASVARDELPRLPAVAELDASGADFAATGGEDYELLFACPPELGERLDALGHEAGVALTTIGRCTRPEDGVVLRDATGAVHRPAAAGFDHFGEVR